MRKNWKPMIVVVVIAAGAIGLSLNTWTRGQVVEVWKQLARSGIMAMKPLRINLGSLSPHSRRRSLGTN